MTESASASHGGSILAINGGSSTLKFALFQAGAFPARALSGSIDRIGAPEATLTWAREGTTTVERQTINVTDHVACVAPLFACINNKLSRNPLMAIGHRVVHGGRYREPQLVTPVVMEELQRLRAYDPEHLPAEIQLIHEFAHRYPHLPQIACFDTAFHASPSQTGGKRSLWSRHRTRSRDDRTGVAPSLRWTRCRIEHPAV